MVRYLDKQEIPMAKGQQQKPNAKKPKQDKSSAPKSAYAQSMAGKGSAPPPFVKKK